MKRFVTGLMLSTVLASFGRAQTTNQASYYSGLTRETIELKAQADLLSRLAQEHKRRAEEPARDSAARQWESELVKELEENSTSILAQLNSRRKERLAFEQAHPELLTLLGTNSPAGVPNDYNPDETAYLGKLDERLAAVQQEMADAIEAGKIYTAQLATNTMSADFSRVTALIQDNGRIVRVLQNQAADLELKKLEFRALRKD